MPDLFNSYSPADFDKAVRTVWGEARGEPEAGQQAVAAVIRNRAQAGGLSPSQVVLAKGQFEPWATRRAQLDALDPNSTDYQKIAATIRPVFAADWTDPTGGATHFYSPSTQAALGRAAPAWDNGTGADIGNHRFFRLGYGAPTPQGASATAQPALPSSPLTSTLRNGSTPMADATPFDLSQFGDYTSPDELAARQKRLMAQSAAFRGIDPGVGSSSGLAALLSGLGGGWSIGGLNSIESDLKKNQTSDQALLRRLAEIDAPGAVARSAQSAPSPTAQAPQPVTPKFSAMQAGAQSDIPGVSLASTGGVPAAMGTATPAIWNNGQGGLPPAAAVPPPSAVAPTAGTPPTLSGPRPGFADTPAALDTERERQRRAVLIYATARTGPLGDYARSELKFDQEKKMLFGLEHEKANIAKQLELEKTNEALKQRVATAVLNGDMSQDEGARYLQMLGIMQGPGGAAAAIAGQAGQTPIGGSVQTVRATPSGVTAAATAPHAEAGGAPPPATFDPNAGLSDNAIRLKRAMRMANGMGDHKAAEGYQKQLETDPTYKTQIKMAEEGGTANAKYYDTLHKGLVGSAMIASQQKQNLDLLKTILTDPGFGFGSASTLQQGTMRALATLGIAPEAAANRETFNMVVARVLADQFSGMKSLASSTGEQGARVFKPMLDMEEKAIPTPQDSIEGLRRKVDIIDQAGDLMLKWGNLADNYAERNNGMLDTRFDRALRGEIAKARINYAGRDSDGAAPKTETTAAADAAATAPAAKPPTPDELNATPVGTVKEFTGANGLERRVKRGDGKWTLATTGDEAKLAAKGLGEDIANSPAAKFVKWLTTKTPEAETPANPTEAPASVASTGRPGSSRDNPIAGRSGMRFTLGDYVRTPSGQIVKVGPNGTYTTVQ